MTRSGARGVRFVTLVLLACATIGTLAFIRDFGQTRFFTIDEYQYGHATWLVTQGRMPYVDFYEHHFPLSYVLHAPILPSSGDFPQRALALRSMAFAYLAMAAAVLGISGWVVTANAFQGWLLACLPLTFGFGLMSAIDYRADNFAACLLVGCFAVLEANRVPRRRLWAGVSGVLFALAVFMTQKMVFIGGGAIALMLARDLLRGRRRAAAEIDDVFLARPAVFVASGFLIGLAILGTGAALGMLPAAFETTVLHTIEHEAHYTKVDFWNYAQPFLAQTPFSSAAIFLFAASFLWFRRGGFWSFPLAVALLGCAAMKAPYPYNFVYPGFLIVICAVRGYGVVVDRVRVLRTSSLWTFLYLLPLAIIPDQLAYLAGTTTNAHQLLMLRKIETFSTPADRVIDGAGGALFRDHASYYWYHGTAHREMFHEYFASDLVSDYRRSGSLFWIDDFRQRELPNRIRSYFERHYVHVDGDLYGIGFATPQTGDRVYSRTVDIVRAGEYNVLVVERRPDGRRIRGRRSEDSPGIEIDGQRVPAAKVQLAVGRHRVEVAAHSPAYIFTPLPTDAFSEVVGRRASHSPLFEYEISEESAGTR